MGFSDFLSNLGGDISSSFSSNPLPWINSAIGTISVLGGAANANDNYGASKAYLDAKMAQDQAQFNATMALKQQELAKGDGGGAAAGAAIAAAKIAQQTALIQMREKILADNLALKLGVIRGQPELRANATQALTNAYQNAGQSAQSGFNSIANILAGGRR